MGKFSHRFQTEKYTDCYRIYSCGDTSARIDFISASCIRVAVFKDESKMLPTFDVCPDNILSPVGRARLGTNGFPVYKPSVEVSDSFECFHLENGITVNLSLDNFILKYNLNNKKLFSDREPLAYNFENEFGKGSYHYLSREADEKIFGLGDKGGTLNKAGRSFRIETTDCMGYDASSSDPLYKHIPFYICENSVGTYGVFYDTSDTAYLDFGKEINNYYEPYKYFKSDDDCLVYYVFFGSKLSVLQQFSFLCGKQAFPPRWSFDYCASTMAYTDAPNAESCMKSFIDKIHEFDLSCGGFYLSSGYTSIGNQRYVFNWDKTKFPCPEKFIDYFEYNNVHLIPNIKPAFLTDHPLYDEISNNGWFIKNPDGTPFVTQFWDGLGSYLDFTNRSAFDFWKKQVTQTLLEFGIKATWNDNNEFDIKDCDALANGFGKGVVNASRLRPTLTYLMVLSSFMAHIEKYPSIRPFLSSRSGGIAIRRLAQTWSGDNRSEFSDLRYCHNIGLTMSLSGLFFYGHDLGGFSGNMPSRELLLRWLQHGVFEPRFTIHSWNSDGSATMPWSYPDIFGCVKALMAQRKRLLPYLYSNAYYCVEENLPLNSPVFLFYDDANIPTENDCLMFGRDILVGFVFDEGKKDIEVYLPSGDNWYLNRNLYHGGQSVSLTISPYDEMPYFVKSGSVVATDEADYGFNGDGKIVFTVYPVEKGSFTARFFNDDGISFGHKSNKCTILLFDVECTENEIRISYKNIGLIPLEPEIKVCDGDKRKVIIE